MKTMLKRGAGVLMPIFSLPSPYGIGTFGRAAYEFIDQLKRGRQTYWQVLPMGPTCYGDSPYQSYSAFAGNPDFIDLDTLKDEKLLTQDEIDACWWCDKQDQVKYDALYYYRFPLLRKAYERSGHKESVEYQAFLEENEEWPPPETHRSKTDSQHSACLPPSEHMQYPYHTEASRPSWLLL